MRLFVTLGLLLGVAASPSALRAQEASRLPSPGAYGLSFRIPEGGGAGFGIRKLLSQHTNAGLDVLVDWSWRDTDRPFGPQQDAETSFRLGLVPNLRLYKQISNDVLPFLLVGATGDYANGPNDGWGWGVGSQLALGVEWFPASGVSLSGVAGMRIAYRYSTDGQGSSIRLVDVGAFRSELMLNVYF